MATVRKLDLPEPIVMTREEWLAHRMTGIGASEIPSILGVNPYKSRFALWAEKTGKTPPVEVSIPMEVGIALEPLVAKFYQKSTGRHIEDPGDCTIWQHPELPCLFCTPDRIVTREDGVIGPLELKTTGEFRAKEWASGEPPLDNQCQHQAQMAVLGCEWGSLAGLVGSREFHHFDIDRNDRFIAVMLSKVEEFWDRVLNDDPPPVDGSESTAQALKALYPQSNGEMVELDAYLLAVVEQWEAAKAEEKDAVARKDEAKAVLIQAIGDADGGTIGQGVTLTNKSQSRKGSITVPVDCVDELMAHGIPYKLTPASTHRVLRRKKSAA